MIIYGKNPVFEAIKAGIAHKVYIRKGAALWDVEFNLPVEVMHKNEFDPRFHKEAQGVAAEIDEIEPKSLFDCLEDIKVSKGVVLLDRIQDPHNFGAIVRSAHCFGIKHIIIPRYNQASITPTVCKASAGAIFYSQIIEETNLGQACDTLKSIGFEVVASDMEGENISEYIKTKPVALIIGSEGRGIRDGLVEMSDKIVSIPMYGEVDSLNAAQSAAIALYEIFK